LVDLTFVEINEFAQISGRRESESRDQQTNSTASCANTPANCSLS